VRATRAKAVSGAASQSGRRTAGYRSAITSADRDDGGDQVDDEERLYDDADELDCPTAWKLTGRMASEVSREIRLSELAKIGSTCGGAGGLHEL
jgi:hypothetical protein